MLGLGQVREGGPERDGTGSHVVLENSRCSGNSTPTQVQNLNHLKQVLTLITYQVRMPEVIEIAVIVIGVLSYMWDTHKAFQARMEDLSH